MLLKNGQLILSLRKFQIYMSLLMLNVWLCFDILLSIYYILYINFAVMPLYKKLLLSVTVNMYYHYQVVTNNLE